MKKKLWERALANRAYWDRYQLAQEGLILNAKVEAKLEAKRARHRAYLRARRQAGVVHEAAAKRAAYEQEQRRHDEEQFNASRTSSFTVSRTVVPIAAGITALCVKCRGALERRLGTINLVHVGPSCRMGFYVVQVTFTQIRCTYPMQRLGKVRPCWRFTVTGGIRCALHCRKGEPPPELIAAMQEAGATLASHHDRPQEAPQRPADGQTSEAGGSVAR
jgi:hypothetical protein